MPSVLGAPYHNGASPMYSTDFMTDEISRQLALSDSMRQISSRGPSNQRAQNAMRVVKPSSANNSPQGMMARRRTLMNDGNTARRRQQALEYALAQQMQEPSPPYSNYQEPVRRNARPVSWHPGSQLQQPQANMQIHQQIPQPDYSQYVIPIPPTHYAQTDMCAGYTNFPPTPMAYSGHTSPVASFSPLSYPFTIPSQAEAPPPQYITAGAWDSSHQVSPNQYSASRSPETSNYFSASSNYFSLDTSNAHVLHSSTAPPTPDDIQPVQQSQALVPPEESIPYQPLEDPEEEEGEILIGMGLYDTPGKTDEDPELGNYRTSASHLLGTTYRRGQGLKLEESWEPPATDDEEEEDEDDSEDADGEEQEQGNPEASQSTPAQQTWI